jgi:Kef-type K+ transport system membrane component KefB
MKLRAVTAYIAMVAAAIVAFLAIDRYGRTLIAPERSATSAAAATSTAAGAEMLLHVLLALAAVVVTGRLLARLFVRIQQPPVIGEVLAGILLGPSLLGAVAPAVSHYVLPSSVAPVLGVIAQLGVILYMFLVGLELDLDRLRHRAHSIVAISHASIVVPFVLGTLLAVFLYPRLSTSDVPFTAFALFMGVAMSITAFPVLARILTDSRMATTELGVVALTCAAADDVTAWCLLAFVVGVARAEVGSALAVAALTLTFIVVMLVAARPLVARVVSKVTSPGRDAIALALAAVLVSALVTERIGVHAIFGAFLFGAMFPHDSALARTMIERLDAVVTILLLPAFFAFTGMRTEIALVASPAEWMMCGLIIAVATAGKFGGAFGAARLTGMSAAQSACLGVLMNTRGLMELIVLNIGLDLGVISPTLFTMMVLMALATTLATTPLLHVLRHETVANAAPRRAGVA